MAPIQKSSHGEADNKIRKIQFYLRPLPMMDAAKASCGVTPEISWSDKYYQQANRMAVLWFLNEHGENAHLLNICFTGDKFPDGGTSCPEDKDGWREGIAEMKDALGLKGESKVEQNIHYLFLPVMLDD
jgi:hypothetical protein